jgi:hypothetical protein
MSRFGEVAYVTHTSDRTSFGGFIRDTQRKLPELLRRRWLIGVQSCKERIMALQAEPLNPLMPSIFKKAIGSGKDDQPVSSIKELSADALVFFGAGETDQYRMFLS